MVQTNFERLLDNLKVICDKTQKVLIGGDFNADPRRHDKKAKILDLWQTDCGLEQHVQEDTRTRLVGTTVQSSLIDHVYSKELVVSDLQSIPSEASDHNLIMLRVPSINCEKIKFQKVIVIDWRKFDRARMNAALQAHLETADLNIMSLDAFNRDLVTAITQAMNDIIPKRVIHTRRDTDIHNYKIEALKKKRDRLFKEARKLKCPVAMAKVKELNKNIKKLGNSEKAKLINTKMKNSSPATFWSTVNGLLGRYRDENDYQIKDVESDGFLSPDQTVQAFADFFRGKVKKLVERNPIEDLQVPWCVKEARIEPFTREEIKRAIDSFKPKR
jgi:hypothetical protein